MGDGDRNLGKAGVVVVVVEKTSRKETSELIQKGDHRGLPLVVQG